MELGNNKENKTKTTDKENKEAMSERIAQTPLSMSKRALLAVFSFLSTVFGSFIFLICLLIGLIFAIVGGGLAIFFSFVHNPHSFVGFYNITTVLAFILVTFTIYINLKIKNSEKSTVDTETEKYQAPDRSFAGYAKTIILSLVTYIYLLVAVVLLFYLSNMLFEIIVKIYNNNEFNNEFIHFVILMFTDTKNVVGLIFSYLFVVIIPLGIITNTFYSNIVSKKKSLSIKILEKIIMFILSKTDYEPHLHKEAYNNNKKKNIVSKKKSLSIKILEKIIMFILSKTDYEPHLHKEAYNNNKKKNTESNLNQNKPNNIEITNQKSKPGNLQKRNKKYKKVKLTPKQKIKTFALTVFSQVGTMAIFALLYECKFILGRK